MCVCVCCLKLHAYVQSWLCYMCVHVLSWDLLHVCVFSRGCVTCVWGAMIYFTLVCVIMSCGTLVQFSATCLLLLCAYLHMSTFCANFYYKEDTKELRLTGMLYSCVVLDRTICQNIGLLYFFIYMHSSYTLQFLFLSSFLWL